MQAKILWADDEIDLLRPHIKFLNEKGYSVVPVKSGDEALQKLKEEKFDLIFLDENMPGISGISSLQIIKENYPSLPVIMITKSEEESLMEQAIGGKISDFIIKPVSPLQILPVIKKHLEKKRIMAEQSLASYRRQFMEISMQLSPRLDWDEWQDIYKKLVYFELDIEESGLDEMKEIFYAQKNEANNVFCRWVQNNYLQWINDPDDSTPVLSHTLFRKKIMPLLPEDRPLFLIIIDNFRYDQWKVLEQEVGQYYWTEQEDLYCSILPTTTQYARNALFAGLMPSEIEKIYPDIWVNDDDDAGKNMHEPELFKSQLKRYGIDPRIAYYKVLNHKFGEKTVSEVPNMMNNRINVIIFNFIDMLSHAGTDTQIVKELAKDASSYRSVVKSWFLNSPLKSLLISLKNYNVPIVITTDHGSVQIKHPVQIIGDKNVNTNLRYKQGKTLTYDEKEVYTIDKPEKAHLPKIHINQKFVFALNHDYFVYPNNYNHFVKYYQDTFQHGGISMEEMIIPIIYLEPKN